MSLKTIEYKDQMEMRVTAKVTAASIQGVERGDFVNFCGHIVVIEDIQPEPDGTCVIVAVSAL